MVNVAAGGVIHGEVLVNPKTPIEFFTNVPCLFSGPDGVLVQKLRGLMNSQSEAFKAKAAAQSFS